MSKRCEICEKGPRTWNHRSHSNKATIRRFKPNIIVKRLKILGGKKVKICSRCYKRLMKEGIF